MCNVRRSWAPFRIKGHTASKVSDPVWVLVLAWTKLWFCRFALENLMHWKIAEFRFVSSASHCQKAGGQNHHANGVLRQHSLRILTCRVQPD